MVCRASHSRENKTSKYVRKECERHLRYLENGGKWVFDEELAHRPIRFIEKFCKPSKGSKRQLVLQPWQHFIIGSLFGWVHKETKLRRFKEALIFMGRKMVKQLLYLVLLTMLFLKMEKTALKSIF